MPDTQISEETLDIAARAVYAVSVQAIEPALGIPMCKFEELPERDLNLHRDYARAAITAALSGHVVGWRTMDSAPKDGTWFLAYRSSTSFGVYSTLVAACWDQESNDFVWPTDIFDVYNPPDLSAHDERGFLEVDVYESQGSFTHWQPLPAPPVPEMEG